MDFPLAEEYSIHKERQNPPRQNNSLRHHKEHHEHDAQNRPAASERKHGTKDSASPKKNGEWSHVAKIHTHPLPKHTDKHKHPHFKHITHRRLGTRNRFATSETHMCRLCGRYREDSKHLAWCPATSTIFETIDALAGFSP